MLTEELRERINRLSHVKRQLLNQQLHQQRAAGASPSTILPGAAAAAVPLSYTQQRIWRTQAANPTATFYNYPQILRLDGALDVGALVAALHYLVTRHDVLRTRFALAGDVPCAVIGAAPAPGDLRFASPGDLSGAFETTPSAAFARTVDDLLYRQITRPFDLAADLPLSSQLLRIGHDAHVLALVHHFAAFDYWSIGLFNRELAHSYNAFAAGSRPALPPLPFTYADYAAWQTSPENEQRLAGMSHYWRWQLAKRPHLSLGPADLLRQRPAAFAADSFEFCLPASMLRRLEVLAQHENATLFMLLLGSLQTLLGRYLERTQIVAGVLVASRPSPAAELLLGNFSNRLLLWGNLAGNPTFRQLLHRVRSATLDAYAHQDVPLERVAVAQVGSSFDPGDLYSVMFDYVNEPLALPGLHGLTVTRLPIQGEESEYPLHITAQRSHDHLRIRLQVRPDFPVHTAVPHMAYHWNTLLSAIAEDPAQHLDDLPLTRHQPRRPAGSGWLASASPLSDSPAARL